VIVGGCDIETTGLDFNKGHKIIEVCFSLYDFETRRHKGYYVKRIHPQRSISAEAQRVHGIDITDLASCPAFKEVAPEIVKLFKACDVVVAHNGINFDFPFIAYELAMAGYNMPRFEPFDTKEARCLTWNGKHPKLKEMAFALGFEYDERQAHSAKYDTHLLMKCFFEGVDRGIFKIGQQEKAA